LPRVRQRLRSNRESTRLNDAERRSCRAATAVARATARAAGRGRRWTDGRLIDREKQFAHGCELVGV